MRSHYAKLLFLGLLVLLLNGCAALSFKTPEEQFVAQIDTFVADLQKQKPAGVESHAPVAVMPASLLRGGQYTRLEEYVAERLATSLRQAHDLYTPTRENWFELREGQPLSFTGQPTENRGKLDRLVVYQIAVGADEVLKQVTVQGMALDARSQPIPGVLADTGFPIETTAGPALLQYQAKPKGNPVPEGLEERPFVSMDRWAYSLASELADAYRANVVEGQTAEVKVVLQTRAINRAVNDSLLHQMESALQQAFVAKKGFACAVSQKDFAPVFAQADFYRKNSGSFADDDMLLAPGTVLLLAEATPHRDGGKVGVNLRALWRGSLGHALSEVDATAGGAYLSGFTARAYLSSSVAGYGGTIISPKDVRSYGSGAGRGFD